MSHRILGFAFAAVDICVKFYCTNGDQFRRVGGTQIKFGQNDETSGGGKGSNRLPLRRSSGSAFRCKTMQKGPKTPEEGQ